jgi:hypothetical protein
MSFIIPRTGPNLPESGPVVFIWTPIPAASNYDFTIVYPNNEGGIDEYPKTNSYTIQAEDLNGDGTYQFLVDARDNRDNILCGTKMSLNKVKPEEEMYIPPTASPTSIYGIPPSIHLPVFISNLNAYCRSGPDPIFSQVSLAFKGQPYSIVGRNLDSSYYYIQVSPQAECWVLASTGQTQGSLTDLPVMITPPTPTVTMLPRPAPVNCSQYTSKPTCTSHPSCVWPYYGCVNK